MSFYCWKDYKKEYEEYIVEKTNCSIINYSNNRTLNTIDSQLLDFKSNFLKVDIEIPDFFIRKTFIDFSGLKKTFIERYFIVSDGLEDKKIKEIIDYYKEKQDFSILLKIKHPFFIFIVPSSAYVSFIYCNKYNIYYNENIFSSENLPNTNKLLENSLYNFEKAKIFSIFTRFTINKVGRGK